MASSGRIPTMHPHVPHAAAGLVEEASLRAPTPSQGLHQCIWCRGFAACVFKEQRKGRHPPRGTVVGTRPNLFKDMYAQDFVWYLITWHCLTCSGLKWYSYNFVKDIYDGRISDTKNSPLALFQRTASQDTEASANERADTEAMNHLREEDPARGAHDQRATPSYAIPKLSGKMPDSWRLADAQRESPYAAGMPMPYQHAADAYGAAEGAPSTPSPGLPRRGSSLQRHQREMWESFRSDPALAAATVAVENSVATPARLPTTIDGMKSPVSLSSDMSYQQPFAQQNYPSSAASTFTAHSSWAQVAAAASTAYHAPTPNVAPSVASSDAGLRQPGHKRGPNFDPENYRRNRKNGVCDSCRKRKKPCNSSHLRRSS